LKIDWARKSELDELISYSSISELLPDALVQVATDRNMVSFVNPYSYTKVLDSSFDLGYFLYAVDGQLLRVLHSFFLRKKLLRKSFDFTSMARDVFAMCEENQWRVGIVGGRPGEPEKAEKNIKNLFPSLNVTYLHHGYLPDEAVRYSCISDLKDASVDILICGMGTPMQEEFLLLARERRAFKWAFSCGGFVSQTAEATYYYPKFVMRFGFRGLYRFYRHDYVRKRCLYDYPRFLLIYVIGFFKKRRLFVPN